MSKLDLIRERDKARFNWIQAMNNGERAERIHELFMRYHNLLIVICQEYENEALSDENTRTNTTLTNGE